jgi:hypothetical protein
LILAGKKVILQALMSETSYEREGDGCGAPGERLRPNTNASKKGFYTFSKFINQQGASATINS